MSPTTAFARAPLQPELYELSWCLFVHCISLLLDNRERMNAFLERHRGLYEARYKTEVEKFACVSSPDVLTQEAGVHQVRPGLWKLHNSLLILCGLARTGQCWTRN